MRMARGVAVVREDQKRQGNARILHSSCPVRMLAHQPTVSYVTSVHDDVYVYGIFEPDSNRHMIPLLLLTNHIQNVPKG